MFPLESSKEIISLCTLMQQWYNKVLYKVPMDTSGVYNTVILKPQLTGSFPLVH